MLSGTDVIKVAMNANIMKSKKINGKGGDRVAKKRTNLQRAREKKKWSVAKLEVESGVSSGAIIKYERETRRPGIDNAMLLADALGVATDDLWRPIKGK